MKTVGLASHCPPGIHRPSSVAQQPVCLQSPFSTIQNVLGSDYRVSDIAATMILQLTPWNENCASETPKDRKDTEGKNWEHRSGWTKGLDENSCMPDLIRQESSFSDLVRSARGIMFASRSAMGRMFIFRSAQGKCAAGMSQSLPSMSQCLPSVLPVHCVHCLHVCHLREGTSCSA